MKPRMGWFKSIGSKVNKGGVLDFYAEMTREDEEDTMSGNQSTDESLPLPSGHSGDTVYSALYAPASAELKKWFKVQVHLYQESEEERARQKALAMDKKAELMGFNPLSLKIERGTQVDAEITVYDDGVRVARTARHLTWNGDLTSAVFEIKAEDSNLQSIAGDVTLSVKGIPVGELSFNTDIVPSAQVDNTPKLGKTKQFDKAFISYSHDDVHTAEVAANILDTLGMCYFFDHHSLKSGAVFGEEIMQSIRESDVFILLWSEHAAQSDYVEKEYLYAKQFAYPQKPKEIATLVIKPYFIEPHADPPAELMIYNFSEMHTRH